MTKQFLFLYLIYRPFIRHKLVLLLLIELILTKKLKITYASGLYIRLVPYMSVFLFIIDHFDQHYYTVVFMVKIFIRITFINKKNVLIEF